MQDALNVQMHLLPAFHYKAAELHLSEATSALRSKSQIPEGPTLNVSCLVQKRISSKAMLELREHYVMRT